MGRSIASAGDRSGSPATAVAACATARCAPRVVASARSSSLRQARIVACFSRRIRPTRTFRELGARREGIRDKARGHWRSSARRGSHLLPPDLQIACLGKPKSGVARPFLKATEPHCDSASVQSGGPSSGHSSGKVPRPSFQGSTRTGQDPPSQPGTPQVTPTPRRRATRRRIGCFVVGSNRTQRP
jgi:hypothetical protein